MRGIITGRFTGRFSGRGMRRHAPVLMMLTAAFMAGAALAGPHGPGIIPGHGPGHDGGPDPARMLSHIAAELDLDPAQSEQVRLALESRREEIRRLHEQLRASQRELRDLDPADPNYRTFANSLAQEQGRLTSRLALLRSETHADIVAVLDEGQQARFAELRAERMARVDRRRQQWQPRPHRPMPPRDAIPGKDRNAGPDGPSTNESGAKEDDVL